MQIDCYRVSESEIDQIIRINSSYFPPDSRSVDRSYIQWLCTQNPFGSAEVFVASEGSDWIGVTILIPIRLRRMAVTQNARYAVNVLSHPEHRSKNIFLRLIDAIRTHLSASGEWLIGHPNAAATPGWTRKRMEFRQDMVPYFLLPTLGLSTVKPRPLATAAELEDAYVGPQQDGKWRIDYSTTFLAWRYLADPLQRYTIFGVSDRFGERRGIYCTCHYAHGVDLLVDFVTLHPFDARSTFRPVLAMLPDQLATQSSGRYALRIPSKRRIRFFVSTWGQQIPDADLQGITLGATDF